MSALIFNEGAAPTAPAVSKAKVYVENTAQQTLHFLDESATNSLIGMEQFISMQGGTFTLVSQTAAQKMFNSPTNGALTVLASTSYQFESYFDLSSMSGSSGTFGWALLGTATFTYSQWTSFANKATLATQVAWVGTANKNSVANTALTAANTNTVGAAYIRGLLRINQGGTIIPAVSQGNAAAAVVGQDSWFRCWPIGSNTIVSLGSWA